MKKALRKLLKVVLIITAIIILFVIISLAHHKICSSKEKDLLTPLGELVEVNGHNMSIYTEGEGNKTLVFLSGGGTCSPILDFKSLYSLLSSEYKIVVVEKLGYGFSDVVEEKRDIDTILSETRMALDQAEIQGPYVLCPHSLSGLEALYWAQKYPDEVEAIVGLDLFFCKNSNSTSPKLMEFTIQNENEEKKNILELSEMHETPINTEGAYNTKATIAHKSTVEKYKMVV